MSNPREKYAVDREREREGTPVEIDDMVFTVRSASASNRGYRYALALAASRHRSELNGNEARAFDVHEDILIDAFADCVILGWQNVTNGDGHPLPFNRENCIALMQDCPAVWDQIRIAALDDTRFRPLAAQEDGEQLGKS